jgi:hypothetical protein
MSRKFVIKALNKFKTKEIKESKNKKETKVDHDVTIYVGKEPDIKEFYLDSKILYDKSDYFKKTLSDNDIEKKDGKYVIKEPDINPQNFDIISR